jgi:Flp pilus assembly protein TadG
MVCERQARESGLLKGKRWGQTLVEFALTAMVLLLIIMGIFDFGRAIYEQHTIADAAREGARYAIIATHTDAGIRQRVRDMAPGTQMTDADIQIDPVGARAGGAAVTVSISHQFDPITPLIAAFMGEDGHLILRSSSSMTVEQ